MQNSWPWDVQILAVCHTLSSLIIVSGHGVHSVNFLLVSQLTFQKMEKLITQTSEGRHSSMVALFLYRILFCVLLF